MKNRILLVTSEIPAGLGYPTAGGGLRAWNLGEGLRVRGFEVHYALMEPVLENRSFPDEHTRYIWRPDNLDRVILEAAPDVVVFCQWHPMSFLEFSPCPIVVDLFGLLLLENWFRRTGEIQQQAQAKLRTLSKADAYLVTSSTLYAYFTAWLSMAGVSPDDFPLFNVPISMPDQQPPLPERREGDELKFVYSGIFWPWQDPSLPLKTLVNTLEKKKTGRLIIYGGKHPVHQDPQEKEAEFLKLLKNSDRVEMRGLVPHEELMESFSEMDVAVDLMAPNVERELSSPIRSACYLWAGLPPVVSNYLYLAKDLELSGGGWTVDPTDEQAMCNLFESLIDNPQDVFLKRGKAQAFSKKRHCWKTALEPLAQFCAEPRYRKKGRHLLDTTLDALKVLGEEYNQFKENHDREIDSLMREKNELILRKDKLILRKDKLEHQLHRAEHDLEAIRSKFLFRLFKRIQDIIAPKRKYDKDHLP